jgi:hypothetical protein
MSTSTANAVDPIATPKVVELVRAIVLDSNRILSGLNERFLNMQLKLKMMSDEHFKKTRVVAHDLKFV